MNAFYRLFMASCQRELRIAWTQQGDVINPLLFFILITSLFPLALNPDPILLQKIAPGVIWVAALLALLLSFDRCFRSDYEDGSLTQMLLSPQGLLPIILAKFSIHWLVSILPLLIITPLLAIFLNLSANSLSHLLLSLLIGTPVLSWLGAIGVALTLSIKHNGMILSLLILPLMVPILIFGANPHGPLLLLSALLIASFSLAPAAIISALKLSIHLKT